MTEPTNEGIEKAKRTRTKPDPELAAISRVGKVVAGLDQSARQRVLQYHAAKAAG